MIKNIIALVNVIFERFVSKDSLIERRRNELEKLKEKRKELLSKGMATQKKAKLLIAIERRINSINKWMCNRQ